MLEKKNGNVYNDFFSLSLLKKNRGGKWKLRVEKGGWIDNLKHYTECNIRHKKFFKICTLNKLASEEY